jgi:hypothetical protein
VVLLRQGDPLSVLFKGGVIASARLVEMAKSNFALERPTQPGWEVTLGW